MGPAIPIGPAATRRKESMSLRIKALSAALGVAIASLAFNAIGCSTVIVGKDVSKTGTIIVGHNEDNGCLLYTSDAADEL